MQSFCINANLFSKFFQTPQSLLFHALHNEATLCAYIKSYYALLAFPDLIRDLRL